MVPLAEPVAVVEPDEARRNKLAEGKSSNAIGKYRVVKNIQPVSVEEPV